MVEVLEGSGWQGVWWWPTSAAIIAQAAGVPDEVREAYEEGVRCLNVKAPHAASAMFRTALAHIVEDKGSAEARGKRNLFQRVEQMVADKTLWESFGEWAHHIRSTGNAGAHGEGFLPVTIEQADDLRKFIRQMIDFLYVQPAALANAMPVFKKPAADTP